VSSSQHLSDRGRSPFQEEGVAAGGSGMFLHFRVLRGSVLEGLSTWLFLSHSSHNSTQCHPSLQRLSWPYLLAATLPDPSLTLRHETYSECMTAVALST
jgi:hypothetical protein